MNKTRAMSTLKGEKGRYELIARTADSEIDPARPPTAPRGAIEGGAERSVGTELELTVAK